MITLHHLPLSAPCRTVRIVLAEKNLEFELRQPDLPEGASGACAPDSGGGLPVLAMDDGTILADAVAIAEYLDEEHPDPALYPGSAAARAEIRRLTGWLGGSFDREVTRCLVGEKVLKRLSGRGSPDSRAIHAGHGNIRRHLEYAASLLDRRKWLAGELFSAADIAAGAHVSCLDYLDDVPWAGYPAVKEWYARMKSRPSFRAILADRLPGEPPPSHYADLDF